MLLLLPVLLLLLFPQLLLLSETLTEAFGHQITAIYVYNDCRSNFYMTTKHSVSPVHSMQLKKKNS